MPRLDAVRSSPAVLLTITPTAPLLMRTKHIAMQQWQFLQDSEGRWYWICTSETSSSQSTGRFATRVDCVADAMRHGYLGSKPGCEDPGPDFVGSSSPQRQTE